MDLKKTKPTKNLEDHTGYGPVDRLLDNLFTRLNPVYAYRNIKGATRQGINLDDVAPSKNLEDRTGGHQNFIRGVSNDLGVTEEQHLFQDMLNQLYRRNKLQNILQTKDVRMDSINTGPGLDALFEKALREHGRATGDKVKELGPFDGMYKGESRRGWFPKGHRGN